MTKVLRLVLLLILAAFAAVPGSAILAAMNLGYFGTVLVAIVLAAGLRSLVAAMQRRENRTRELATSLFLLLLLGGSLEDSRLKALARSDPEAYRLEMAAKADRQAARVGEIAKAREERERASTEAQTKQAERERCRDEIEALTYAQLAVKQKLIAPKTADFPWTDHRTYQISCGRWRVASYVDSQNAFGAMIRKHWAAEVRWVPESEAWVAEYVHFN